MHDDRSKGFTEKRLHGKFRKCTKAIANKKSWEWLKMGWMKKGTEAIITAAQDHVLWTNRMKDMIDKQDTSRKCRICQTEDELAMHIASGCKCIAEQQYKVRHNAVGRWVHWELNRKYGIQLSKNRYQHMPEKVSTSANSNVEITGMLGCGNWWKGQTQQTGHNN